MSQLPEILTKAAFLREKQLIGSKDGEIQGVLPFSRATLWRKVKDGTFPSPLKLSERTTAWRSEDISRWISDPSCYQQPN